MNRSNLLTAIFPYGIMKLRKGETERIVFLSDIFNPKDSVFDQERCCLRKKEASLYVSISLSFFEGFAGLQTISTLL